MVRATGYLLTALVWIGAARAAAAERPNVLLILADDCTYNDLPLYGGKNARTPNIDRLAGEGLTFDRAYLTSAMCQPARAELYTGQFPMRNGCAWNHSASRPNVKSLPHRLGALGYRVGLAGKVHVEPAAAFPFERVEKHLMGWDGDGKLNNPYWQTWVREAWASERTYSLVRRYLHRPAEQLYDTRADAYELVDLAASDSLAEEKARLSAELDRWLAAQGDPGAAQDTTSALEAARRGRHLHGVK